MLLLLGSDGNDLESPIAKRFGHAAYYLLYDTETHHLKAFENGEEGHNHDSLRHFLAQGVEAFIVGNIGPHAFDILDTPDSKVYLARKMTGQEAIEQFSQGALQQLSEPTAKRSIGHGLANETPHGAGSHRDTRN